MLRLLQSDEQLALLVQGCRGGGGDDVIRYDPSSPLRTRRLITVPFFFFFLDNWPIKCIHTTEDTGRIPRCVSITAPNNICSLRIGKINTGCSMLDYLS